MSASSSACLGVMSSLTTTVLRLVLVPIFSCIILFYLHVFYYRSNLCVEGLKGCSYIGLNFSKIEHRLAIHINHETFTLLSFDTLQRQSNLSEAISRWALVLLSVMLLMLFISVVLIAGTVRLSLYSNRFSIRTMELVGASESFISRPYVGRAAGQGLLAALLASALLFALLNAVAKSFPQIFEIFSLGLLARCAVILALAGILVCAICARAVTRRLVRMDQNELYG